MDPAAMETKLNVIITNAFNCTSFDILSMHTGAKVFFTV